VIDEFNSDNFDHTGLGFFGGGYTNAVNNWRPFSTACGRRGHHAGGTKRTQANANWYAHALDFAVHAQQRAGERLDRRTDEES
jgi:gluconate 2-dehydrogenase alpha chain